MPSRANTNDSKWRNPLRVALGVTLFALTLRILFIIQSEAIPVIRAPTPGMDIDIYWNAARMLLHPEAGDANFELMICSAPFHAYWTALIQLVVGESMLAARLAVTLLASLRYALLFYVCLRLSKTLWASAAATLLVAALPAAIYFDTVLLKAATTLNLLVLLLFFVTAAVPTTALRRTARSLIIGVILSLSFLNQLATFLFAGVVLAYFACLRELAWKQRAAYAAPAVGLFLVVFAAFHLQAKKELVPHSGLNVLLGFNARAGISYNALPRVPAFPHGHAFIARLSAELESGAPMTPQEANSHYLSQALDYVRDNPGRSLSLVLARTAAVFNSYEIKGGDQTYYLADHSLVMRSPVRYGLMFVCGVFGLVALIVRRRGALLVLLGGLLAAVAASSAINIVTFRTRAPTIIVLAILASLGLPYVAAKLRELRAALAASDPPPKRNKRAKKHRRDNPSPPPGPSVLRAAAVLVLVGGTAAWFTWRPILSDRRDGYDRQAVSNNKLSMEREQHEAELRAKLETAATSHSSVDMDGLIAAGYASLSRHTEAYRMARKIVASSLASRDANALYIRYLLWLGDYAQASVFATRLRESGQDNYDFALSSPHLSRFERAAFRKFAAP